MIYIYVGANKILLNLLSIFEFPSCLCVCNDHETLFTYQSQHTLLVSDPESCVVQLLMGRQEVHIGGRVLEKQRMKSS